MYTMSHCKMKNSYLTSENVVPYDIVPVVALLYQLSNISSACIPRRMLAIRPVPLRLLLASLAVIARQAVDFHPGVRPVNIKTSFRLRLRISSRLLSIPGIASARCKLCLCSALERVSPCQVDVASI